MTLAAQRAPLEAWIDEAAQQLVPFAILGDFNRRIDRFGQDDHLWREIDDGDPTGLDLLRLPFNREAECNPSFPQPIDLLVFDDRAWQLVDEAAFAEITYDLLRSGACALRSWTHDGEEIAFLGLRVRFGILHLEGLDHRYEARKIGHSISTTSTPCTYGGSRPWFLFPNCGRRAGKLYLPLGGHHFLCRRCYDLGYESQWEEPWWRAKRCARKLWQRLGGDPDDDLIPPRPKGMHWRTYERLIADAERAEDLVGASIAASMSKRFGRRFG